MWPSRRFVVDVACNEDGEKGCVAEVPLMDGSALPFFSEFRRNVGAPEELAFYDVSVHASWDLFRTDGTCSARMLMLHKHKSLTVP